MMFSIWWDYRKIAKQPLLKWIFKLKTGADRSMQRYKAILVAKIISQKFGFDYGETFCPVVRFESTWTVTALAVQNDLKLH